MYSSFSQPTTTVSQPPPAPTASPVSANASTVILFGPPTSLIEPILQHFSEFGEIIRTRPDPEGGNWVAVTYKTEAEAAKAVRFSGEVLGGAWMIGVKWAVRLSPCSPFV